MIATQGPFRGRLETAFFAPMVKDSLPIEVMRVAEHRWWAGGGHFAMNRIVFITLRERRAFSV